MYGTGLSWKYGNQQIMDWIRIKIGVDIGTVSGLFRPRVVGSPLITLKALGTF